MNGTELSRGRTKHYVAAGLFLLAVGIAIGSGMNRPMAVPERETVPRQATTSETKPIREKKAIGGRITEAVRNALGVRPVPARDEVSYSVVRVVDGDTLVVAIDGKNEKVRLIGADTPETVDPRRPVQCFGREASAKAKELLGGKRVRLESDDTQSDRDKYGRLLRYVYIEGMTVSEGASQREMSINEYLIREGYAHEYTYQIPYRYQAEFKAAQRFARENKKGLWADGVCGKNATTTAQ